MRRKKLEKALLCLSILLFFVFGLNIWLEAQSDSDSKSKPKMESNASGSGESITKDGKWSEPQSGYRFTIVDKDFNAIKNRKKDSIDILFSESKQHFEKYANARTAKKGVFTLDLEQTLNREYLWKDVIVNMGMEEKFTVVPPYPINITDNNEAIVHGDDLEKWMMQIARDDQHRIDLLLNAYYDRNLDLFYFEPQGFKEWRKDRIAKGTPKEECRPFDYMNEMGYNLIVEPIYWFPPTDSEGGLNIPINKKSRNIYGNILYGTTSNFVKWFNDPAHEPYGRRYYEKELTVGKAQGYENHGGNYSVFVSRAGKTALRINKDIKLSDFMTLPDPTQDKILIKAPREEILHLDGIANRVEEMIGYLEGNLESEDNVPYGYAMQFYYVTQKPTQPPKIIPKPTPQPDHKYGLTGHIVVSSDEFDVSKEQPVDENVKISAFVDDPIVLDYTFKQVDYTNTYNVTFVQPYSDGHSVSKKEQYIKNGTYYEIDHLSCFRIKHVDVFSKSLLDMDYLHLPIRLGEEHLTKALDTIDIYQNQNHIFFDANSYAPNSTNSLTITLPTKSVIKTKVKVKNKKGVEEEKTEISYPPMSYSEPASEVCNDHIQIGSQIMMEGKEKTSGTSAPAPTEFKGSGQSEFRLHPYKIPIKIPNANNPTTGDLLYELVVDIDATLKELKPDKIKGNDVHIFTPVGVSFKMNERPEFDQRHDEDELRKKGIPAFVINRVLKFDIDTKRPDFAVKENQKGMHYKRPDGRDTVRFMDHIAIVCGFDAYVSTKESDISEIKTDKKFYYEADDTIKLDKNTKTIYIKPANWAKELENSLSVYSVAKNYIAYKKPYQSNPYENIEDQQVAAKKRIDVDIVGRLFDLRVHHVDDPNWIENYQKQDAFFVTGLGGLNGQEREGAHAYILQLPVRNGKNLNKGHQKLFPRLGYKVEFSVRTMGDFYFSNQLIGITPKYYVIDEDTDQRVEVDLYYKSKGGYERYQDSENPILVGKNQLRHKYSAARKEDMQETLKIYESGYLPHKEGFNQLPAREFVQNINIPINCNYPDILQLRSLNRVFVGDRFAYYPSKDIRKKHLYRASAQQWYGRFYLPSSIVAVRKDTDLREAYRKKEKFFIDKGYLIVNFDVNVYSGGEKYNEKAPRLSYRTSTSNTWENEGYQNRFRDDEIWDFQLKYGDVLIFDLSKRATDRLKVGR